MPDIYKLRAALDAREEMKGTLDAVKEKKANELIYTLVDNVIRDEKKKCNLAIRKKPLKPKKST